MYGIVEWSKSVVISVVMTVIIEMILPENNSKKYIKIVLGIFIVYSIISPIFEFFSGKNVDEIIDRGEAAIQASSVKVEESTNEFNTDTTIRGIYSNSLEQELKNILQNNGYIADEIQIAIANDESYNIDRINIKIKEKTSEKKDEKQVQSIVDTVKQIVIKCDGGDNNSECINECDTNQIKELVKNNFRC